MSTVHTYPVGDLVEHDTDGGDCICGPTTEAVVAEDGAVDWQVVHHSLDGREAHEADPANVPKVPLDPDLSRRLTQAGRKSDEWKARRDDLIREAARNGGTLREIAAAVDMSNPGVLRVIRRGPLETRHITPLHQGGDKDDPDNIEFVSPEENRRLHRPDPES